MTQNIGSLAVSLSLDASNFNGSMSQVDRNLRAMGSELRAVRARGTEYGNSLEGLSSRQNVLRRSLDAANIKLTETRRRYDEMVASGTANEAQLERQARRVNDAQTQYNRLEAELNDVEQALRRQSSSWHQFSERLAPIGARLTAIGQGMTNIGRNLSMKVTAPLMALGTGAFKAAVDFESAFAGVKKTVDASESQFESLKMGIRGMSKELPTAASDIAAVAESAGQLGIETDSILGFTRTIIDLGEATNLTREQAATEFARFANIVGMSQKDFDRLGSSVVSLGNNMATTESEIMSMGMRLAAQGALVGMTEAQIMALSATMSSLGIEAEAGGTAMTTVLKKIDAAVGTGGKALEGFSNAAGANSKVFADAWKSDPIVALDMFIKGLSESSNQGKNLTNILSDLGIKGIRESDTILRMAGASNLLSGAVENASSAWAENNALSNEASQRYETTASKLKMLWNQITDIGISLGEVLIPKVQALTSRLTPLIDRFANMSTESQNTILAIGGIAAAMGPLLVVGGSLLSGIGGLVTTISTLSAAIAAAGGASAVFGGALAVLTGPIGLTVAALAGLTVGGIIAYKKATEDAIPKAELFGDSVSEGTKKAVGGFLELNETATLALNELSWSGKKVSKEAADSITENFTGMAEQIRQGMEKKNTESLALMESFLVDSKFLSDREKQEVLENMNTKYAEQQNAITNGENIIKGILEKASQEKRSLTKEEQIQINNIQEGMVKNGISALSKNEIEAKSIMERMKAQAGDISAQQAAEVVRNSKKQKDGAVKEAEEQYDKTVQEIIRQRDELGTITASQAERLILEAKKQKDQTVKQAEEMHLKVVGEAQKQAKEHVDKVNWETGEILSKWEVFKNNASRKWDEIKSSASKKWDEISKATSEKWETIVAWPGKKMDEMKTSVKTKMEEVQKNVEIIWNKTEKFLADIDLIQIGKDIISGLVKGIDTMASEVWKKIESVAEGITSTIKKVLGIQSPSKVTTNLGKETGQGFVNGIASMSKAAQQAAKNTANQVKKAFNGAMDKAKYELKMGNINSSEYISELRKIRDEYAKTPDQVRKVNLEIKRIEDQRAKELKTIREKEFKDALKTIKDKAAAGKLATDQELKMLQELASNHRKNSKERLEVEKEIKKVKDKLLKEEEARLKKQFDKEKDYLDRKKSLNKMSLTQELEYLEKKKEAYQKNSNQRKWYEGEVHRVKKEINDKLIFINDEYVSKVQEANQKLIAGEKQLNEEYQKALDDRAKTLYTFAGIFDELKEKSDVSGQQLIENLRGQVQVFQEWQSNISSLATRGISEGLLKELSDMGPKAYAEIAALNSLTDEQLSEYSALWEQKNVLAKEQAIKELENMKIDTQKKIEELKIQTAAELDKYKKEWESKIKQISSGTKKQFNAMAASMPQIGKNAVEGLMAGMKQMEGPLMAQAKAIADSIKSTIQSALDIHSPSRIMRGFGVNIGEGLILGMNDTVAKVGLVAEGLASAATMGMERGSESKTTIDKSKHFNPQITIHTHESGEKAMDRTLRRLSFEF